jgi:Mg-chelatase subunit ChlI
MALHVEVGTILNPTMRVAVMKANLEFEDDPFGFREKHNERQDKLRGKILKARKTQHTVPIPDYLFETTAQMCINLKVDGHRPDIIIMKAARALAAYKGREEVIAHDVVECAALTLGHRTRNLGMEPPASENQINDEFEKAMNLNRPSTGGNDG